MEELPTPHVLRELATGALENVDQLEREDPESWLLTGFAANLSQALLASAMRLEDLVPDDRLPLLLWQQMTKYQFQSLLHFVCRDLDAGYTLLRNGTELVRDIVCLGFNAKLAADWWKARSAGKPDNQFRFNRSDPLQALVHDIYKGASNWGTHGHITGLSGSEPSGLAGIGDRIQIWQVTDTSRDQALGMWLLAFVPMQTLCARVFRTRASADLSRFLEVLTSQSETFGRAAKRLQSRPEKSG